MPNATELLDMEYSEGHYIFLPDWNNSLPKNFGKLDKEITHQRGDLIEQWIVTFEDKVKGEQGMINIRFAPKFWNEIIEFEVLLNPINIDDYRSKDITVNWQFYNEFDPQGRFWTDSNALGMVKRHLEKVKIGYEPLDKSAHPNYKTISANFYPVDSAITMRDFSGKSSVQVNVMNDRAQGGTADLTDRANIELMQNRRILFSDDMSPNEALNETEYDGLGIQSNAKYYVQIFDTQKAKSQQRSQQLRIQEPPIYFFNFDYELDSKKNNVRAQLSDAAQLQKTIQFKDDQTYQLLPGDHNQILVRFENLADKVDDYTIQKAEAWNLDIHQFALSLFQDVNPNAPNPSNIKIE